MGDLNMQAGQAVRVSGLQPLAPATTPTFPLDEPTRQLDHVLARGPIAASGPAEALRLSLSDHRALVVPCAPA
jgi:endonuclease/exonuclease/phosphatase family metal-dependent hydrolase